MFWLRMMHINSNVLTVTSACNPICPNGILAKQNTYILVFLRPNNNNNNNKAAKILEDIEKVKKPKNQKKKKIKEI